MKNREKFRNTSKTPNDSQEGYRYCRVVEDENDGM